jgi:hypothetical protein
MTNPSLRGVPSGRDDEAICIFTKKVDFYERMGLLRFARNDYIKSTNDYL